jgi:hypothetical protein
VKRVLLIIFAVLALATVAKAIDQFATCPQDGENGQWTGATKGVSPHMSCQYSHVAYEDRGGLTATRVDHKFWAPCD